MGDVAQIGTDPSQPQQLALSLREDFFLPDSAKIEQSLGARRLPQSQPLGAFLRSADPAVLQLIV